jgi:hypothetical protein
MFQSFPLLLLLFPSVPLSLLEICFIIASIAWNRMKKPHDPPGGATIGKPLFRLATFHRQLLSIESCYD